MPTFVHLTPAKDLKRIVRSGIKHGGRGVFCMPVLPNYYISHQWIRELKRGGQRTIVGVYFTLPDEELVWVGHYFQAHTQVTAAEASRVIRDAARAEGYEVIVTRAIPRDDIQKVRAVPQVMGWRYMPDSHSRVPCLCPYCIRGDIKSQRLRRRTRSTR